MNVPITLVRGIQIQNRFGLFIIYIRPTKNAIYVKLTVSPFKEHAAPARRPPLVLVAVEGPLSRPAPPSRCRCTGRSPALGFET